MMSGNGSNLLKQMLQSEAAPITAPSVTSQPSKTVFDLLQRKKYRCNGNDENSLSVSNSVPISSNGVATKQINGNPVNQTVQLLPHNQILSQPPSQPIVLPPTTIVTSQQNVQTDGHLLQSLINGSSLQQVNMNSISNNTQTINTQLLNQVPQQPQQQQFIFTNSNTTNVPATPILIVPQNPNGNASLTQILQGKQVINEYSQLCDKSYTNFTISSFNKQLSQTLPLPLLQPHK